LKQVLVGAIVGILIYSFKLFSPLAYGWSDASSETNSAMDSNHLHKSHFL
jgi:dolichyl-phosphate-mannose--protein O-mannosyl transferase